MRVEDQMGRFGGKRENSGFQSVFRSLLKLCNHGVIGGTAEIGILLHVGLEQHQRHCFSGLCLFQSSAYPIRRSG